MGRRATDGGRGARMRTFQAENPAADIAIVRALRDGDEAAFASLVVSAALLARNR